MQYSGTCDLVCAKIMCRLLGLFHTDDHKHIPAWCVSKRKDPKYAGLWLCGSVAPSDHRSLHLPASRGGFQEMPQVVAVQEIPPDYNQRLYKDAAHWTHFSVVGQGEVQWNTRVFHCGCTCSSCLWQFLSDVVQDHVSGPCGPMWSATGRSRPCGRATQLHKVRCISCFIWTLSDILSSVVNCDVSWTATRTFQNWAEIHSKTY